MKQKLFFSLITIFMVASCTVPLSSNSPPPTPVISKPEESQTPAEKNPIKTSMPIETIETPTPQMSSKRFFHLDMLDPLFGTALLMGDNGEQTLISTHDGGKTWSSIMPQIEGYIISTAFSSSEIGFFTAQSSEGKTSLWSTSDGGLNWQSLELVENMTGARLILIQDEFMLARVEDVGAGSAYVHYYESTDQGKTWSLLPLLPPEPEEGLPEGVIRICNICGDLIAQSEFNSLIVYGEMANDPKNSITLDVTNDRGLNWQRIEISKPIELENSQTQPIYLNLGDARWLALFSLVQFDPTVASHILVLESLDQGETWELFDPTPETHLEIAFNVIQVNQELIALICEGEVCLLDFSVPILTKISLEKIWENEDLTSDLVLELTDNQHAWLVINALESSNIYQTSDGGENWALIKSTLIEVSP